MRLHHLRATAFGPFAGAVDVDFDELSTAGLFLLSGPTGAGKTSVLDAVCFALYGEVPGDRGSAKRLRSDLAAPDVRPQVVLEATLGGRRFRITRTPSWERAKRRGEGRTTEQASVVVEERVAGAWVTQSTRLDESGHLIARLIGMNVTQFTQVAMLPQGRFQAFLRARSEERHRLLQQLFRTGRFEDVERWLRDRRLDLRRRADAARETVADLVSRVGETTGTEPGDDERAETWAAAHRDAAVTARATSAAAAEAAAQAEAEARAGVEAARALHERRARIDAAAAEQARLLAASEEHDRARGCLEAARRAAPVVPLHTLAVRARRARSAAHTGAPSATREEVEALLADVVAEAARVRALEPRARRLDAVVAETERVRLRRAELTEAASRARVQARDQVAALTLRLREAEERYTLARQESLDLRERAVSLREERVNGMAAEIAAGLVVGGSCPVCGSCDHPRKASAPPGAPDEAAERRAQRAVDDAAAAEFTCQSAVHDLTTALAAASERIDVVPPAIATELGATEASLAALGAEAADLAAELADFDAGRLAELDAAARGHRSALAALDRLASAEAALADAEEALALAVVGAGFADADEALAAALDQRTYDALADRLAAHEGRLAAVTAVLQEPGAAEVAATDPPALDALTAVHRDALRVLGDARADERAWATRAERLERLAADLDRATAAWRPVRDELEVLTTLSSFVEGKSADNRLQMRLSAYVLAYRLTQVVAAANERLDRMSDRRYALEHTARRGAGETRGGLSLVVRDDWSGEARDPATLSGGETFVVSLALALGLADVVTQEAGGADLDTLFVDEGFGALDPDTLDDVMDTLDSLRDGGRVVGVVSHVAEMRDRIPTQLLVGKSRQGSSVAISR